MTAKHNCPPYYKEELKKEIIAQSAAIHKKINSFTLHRIEIVCIGFGLIIFAAWAGKIHPALFPVALLGGYTWLALEWRKLSKEKRAYLQQDHGETHRLAQIFQHEQESRKEYCLGELKGDYANS